MHASTSYQCLYLVQITYTYIAIATKRLTRICLPMRLASSGGYIKRVLYACARAIVLCC